VPHLPTPSERREKNILELVEWAQLQGLNPNSKQTHQILCREAKKQFLVTDETAKDYAGLAMRVLADDTRAALELNRMRERRLEWK
jgi:hypothetical protein